MPDCRFMDRVSRCDFHKSRVVRGAIESVLGDLKPPAMTKSAAAQTSAEE